MKNFQFLKKIIWILPLFVIIIFVFYYFVYLDIQQKNKKVSELQSSAKEQLERDLYFKSIQNIIQNDQDGIDKINNSIIGSDKDVDFIENFEKVAKNNGLEVIIDSISVDNLVVLAKTNMTTLDIKARTKGNWVATYTFLKELDSLPFIVRIDKFALVSASDISSDTNAKKGSKPNKIWQSVFEIHALKNK